MLNHLDKHLNVFINYNEKYWLENNMTKAIVNTLELLDTSSQLELIAELVKSPAITQLDKSQYHCRFALQSKPRGLDILAVPSENRILLGLSPTGGTWNEKLLDIRKLKLNPTDAVQEIYTTLFSEVTSVKEMEKGKFDKTYLNFAQAEYDTLLWLDANHGSIPDGWILIEKDGQPVYCIIIENKLYDLNPYQLRNHRQKSLEYNAATTITQSFSTVYDLFLRKKNNLDVKGQTTLIPHLLEYMTIMGYEPVHRFYPNDVLTIRNANSEEERKFYKELLYQKFFNFFQNYCEENGYDFNRKKRCMNITGISEFNFVFEFDVENAQIIISSEIGNQNAFVSQKILAELQKADSDFAQQVQNDYPKSTFERFIRMKSSRAFLYFPIAEYDHLNAYIDSIKGMSISDGKIPKDECLKFLTTQHVHPDEHAYAALKRYQFQHWHKLEYLRILDRLELDKYLYEPNHASLKRDLTMLIEQHIIGLKRFQKELSL